MKSYSVSQSITYQAEIVADSEEQARELFRQYDVRKMPIVDCSDVEAIEK